MTDEEYLRAGIELAEEWHCSDEAFWYDGQNGVYWLNYQPRQALDALAAQLVRQVDATEHWYECSVSMGVRVWLRDGSGRVFMKDGANRAMNTIKAVVDSGVLTAQPRQNDDG